MRNKDMCFVPNSQARLVNVGNTCFFNSAVQCFFHVRQLRLLMLAPGAENFAQTDTQRQLQELFRDMASGKWDSIAPLRLLHSVIQYDPAAFGGGHQHDASELFAHLVHAAGGHGLINTNSIASVGGIVQAELPQIARVAAEAEPLAAQDLILQALSQPDAKPTRRADVILLQVHNIYNEADFTFLATARVRWGTELLDLSSCFHGEAGPSTYVVRGFIQYVPADTQADKVVSGTAAAHYVAHVQRDGHWFVADDAKTQACPDVTAFPYIVCLERVLKRSKLLPIIYASLPDLWKPTAAATSDNSLMAMLLDAATKYEQANSQQSHGSAAPAASASSSSGSRKRACRAMTDFSGSASRLRAAEAKKRPRVATADSQAQQSAAQGRKRRNSAPASGAAAKKSARAAGSVGDAQQSRGGPQQRKGRQRNEQGRQRDQKGRDQKGRQQSRQGRQQFETRKKRAWGQQDAANNQDNSRYDVCAEADNPLARFKENRGNFRERPDEKLREWQWQAVTSQPQPCLLCPGTSFSVREDLLNHIWDTHGGVQRYRNASYLLVLILFYIFWAPI